MAALLSALFFSLVFGNWFIDKSKLFFRSKAREWAPESHKEKDNMPTMGGLFILMAVLVNVLVWCNLLNPQVWVVLLSLIGFGAIGFWDDWCKIRYNKGISARAKFIGQWSVAALVSVLLVWAARVDTTLIFPFVKSWTPDIGALRELEQAKSDLEEILRQLREEEIERRSGDARSPLPQDAGNAGGGLRRHAAIGQDSRGRADAQPGDRIEPAEQQGVADRRRGRQGGVAAARRRRGRGLSRSHRADGATTCSRSCRGWRGHRWARSPRHRGGHHRRAEGRRPPP